MHNGTLFACVFKVYCTLSSRRFGYDLADAADAGHQSKPMHPEQGQLLP
jgi:hypothetical protein